MPYKARIRQADLYKLGQNVCGPSCRDPLAAQIVKKSNLGLAFSTVEDSLRHEHHTSNVSPRFVVLGTKWPLALCMSSPHSVSFCFTLQRNA